MLSYISEYIEKCKTYMTGCLYILRGKSICELCINNPILHDDLLYCGECVKNEILRTLYSDYIQEKRLYNVSNPITRVEEGSYTDILFRIFLIGFSFFVKRITTQDLIVNQISRQIRYDLSVSECNYCQNSGYVIEDDVLVDGELIICPECEGKLPDAYPIDRTIASPEDVISANPKLFKDFINEKGDDLCCICRDAKAKFAFIECEHKCMCEDCLEMVDSCPLCRVTGGAIMIN